MTDFELTKELANRLYVRGILDNNPNSQTGNVFPLVFDETEINFYFTPKGELDYVNIDTPIDYDKVLTEEFLDIYLEDAELVDLLKIFKKIAKYI